MYVNLRIEAMLSPEMIEELRPEAKRLAKKIEQEIKLEMEAERNNLNNYKNMNKSGKSNAIVAKNGTMYIVFNNLPDDQQKAWSKINTRYTCPIIDEEEKNVSTLFYHDYENFYENWIKGKEAFHLD